jgi:hypothetical protein
MFYRLRVVWFDVLCCRCRLFVGLLLLLLDVVYMYEIQVYTDAECPNQ